MGEFCGRSMANQHTRYPFAARARYCYFLAMENANLIPGVAIISARSMNRDFPLALLSNESH